MQDPTKEIEFIAAEEPEDLTRRMLDWLMLIAGPSAGERFLPGEDFMQFIRKGLNRAGVNRRNLNRRL